MVKASGGNSQRRKPIRMTTEVIILLGSSTQGTWQDSVLGKNVAQW